MKDGECLRMNGTVIDATRESVETGVGKPVSNPIVSGIQTEVTGFVTNIAP